MSSMSQLVEYLGMTKAIANAPVEGIVEAGDTVIVVAIRPEPTESFHTHNLALTYAQAVRFLEDLQSVLAPILSTEQVVE